MRGGSIHERTLSDGSVAHFVMWRDSAGRQCKRTIRDGRKAAEKFLNARLAERDGGAVHAPDRQRFAEYAADWLAAKKPRLEIGTYLRYEADVRLRLVPAFGDLKLRQVTRSRIEAMLAKLDAQRDEHGQRLLSRKTINGSLIPLRGILDRAVRDGILLTNPARGRAGGDTLELPYEEPEMQYLKADEARDYLAACGDWYRPAAELLLGTGIRAGELLALDWRDADLDLGTLRISRSVKADGSIGGTKGDRGRVVPLDPHLVAVLLAHRRASGGIGGFVFRDQHGDRLTHDALRLGHVAALKAAGLGRIRLHDLRHTHGTLAVSFGMPLTLVQAQLGHRDVRTTMRYAHADADAHRAAAAKVATGWRG